MKDWFIFIWLPILSAFVHWITIWMALKLLFHPKKPISIFGYKLQGIFPKRQLQIAQNLGSIVGKELLSFDDIENKLSNAENLKTVLPFVEGHLDEFLHKKIKDAFPMMSMFIGDKTINEIKTVFMHELEIMFPKVMKQYAGQLKNQLDLEKIVVEKIANFSSDKLEAMLNQIMTKEFRVVEIIGTILGFIIGIVQAFISYKIN